MSPQLGGEKLSFSEQDIHASKRYRLRKHLVT